MDPGVNLYDELPSFASEQNKEKHAMIMQKNAELAALNTECEELKDRLTVITEHLRSVKIEVVTTQQIVQAKEEDVKAEKHLQQVAVRENGKIHTELQKIEAESLNVQAKNSQVESRIFKSQERINALKEAARMNQEQLEQWVQAARDKEEDFLVLQRYQREDEGRIRSMLLEIEKATAVIQAKEAELEQEVTATRALQIELDRTAEQCRKLHEERSRLLAQWEGTLEKMQTLNAQIEPTTNMFERRKGDVAKYAGMVHEGKKNLEAAELENRRYERKIIVSDGRVSHKHRQWEQETRYFSEFSQTVDTQRYKLGKSESDARAYREEITELRGKIQIEMEKRQQYTRDCTSQRTHCSRRRTSPRS
jgi:chromosome segregation ATPase